MQPKQYPMLKILKKNIALTVFAIILNFRESQLTLRPKMPHSTGYERAKQHCFNFDCDYIQQFRQNPHDNVCNAPPMSPTWQRYFYNFIDILFFSPQEPLSPYLAPPPTPVGRRSRRPPPLQIPQVIQGRSQVPSYSRQIWVSAEQRDGINFLSCKLFRFSRS